MVVRCSRCNSSEGRSQKDAPGCASQASASSCSMNRLEAHGDSAVYHSLCLMAEQALHQSEVFAEGTLS